MKAIQIISQDLFDKVRSRFANLEMGDETGAVTVDPTTARFFDFDFVLEGVNLGRISVSLNDPGSLKIYYSQGITENRDTALKKLWYEFLKEMRFFAMRRLLRFDTRDISKTSLDKNDFQYLATKSPKEEKMNESKWNHKSSRKTSRAVKGSTEVIVRHHSPVDEMYAGSRSQRKNIKSIFIQNRDGERFKYPFIHSAGAFAMAQHVDHGGKPHDSAGKAIVRMSEQIAQLQEFQRQVQRTSLHDDAMGITERAVGRLSELKAQIEALGKRHYYESWIAEFNEVEDPMLGELDAVTMETYKQKFTQTDFKEELANFFPLIHSIMQEKINLEDYVKESDITDSQPDTVKESEFAQFEQWAEAVEQGKLTDDQIQSLVTALDNLQTSGQTLTLGPNGQTAIDFFKGAVELDPESPELDADLEEKFKLASDAMGDEQDALEVFQTWAQESYPELLVALGMSGTQAPQTEPAALPAPDEQNIAEGQPIEINGKEVDPRSIEVDGIDRRDYPDFSDAYISYAEYTDGTPLSDQELDAFTDQYGDIVNDLAHERLRENEEHGGFPNDTMSKESNSKDMIKMIAEKVKSFYNRDNPTVGPFRGEEGIAIDVEKTIAEKFGDGAGQQAKQLAEKFMEKLTLEWQQRHGVSNPVDHTDGLARLKELLGNVKAKVEGMGQETDEGVLNKVKSLGKKVLNKLAPDDATLLKQLEKDSGGRIPPRFEPKHEPKNEMESILKLAGLKK